MSTQNSSNKGTNWSMGAALGAAVAASACCTIPLVLVSLGIGGVWIGGLTALAPYRWIFVSLAVGGLGYAGYNEWQMSRQPDCDCETIVSSTTRRLLLGAGTLAVMALVVSPWLIGPSPRAATQQARTGAGSTTQPAASQSSTAPASFQQVVLTVEGMTCAACPQTVQTALRDVDGVYEAEATLEPPEAVVRFDPDRTSIEALTQATEHAGFPSASKSAS
ncbi:mercury transporter MerT [Longimonas halophila]|uniref:Mercuric transport protein MerT n=1 Tax=Longimonas halophila TaxID=1469170 RepID=A0A2H3NQ84_9BACT|nr:mercury transporter MerT [Longimonas halophila]